MRTFDPIAVAHYETASWVAYYQRKWLTLLWLLIGLVRSTYGVSVWQAISLGIPLIRAQRAFAPKDNDVSTAIAYMRRFFADLKELLPEDFDPDEAALTEVSWWVVHRKFFGRGENSEVAEAVACAYAAVYQLDRECVREAAHYRARAMVYSDSWVLSDRDPHSPLLNYEEEELVKAYTALRAAVSAQ